MAKYDPDRVARLPTDAERSANSIPEENSKASALSDIAEALAATPCPCRRLSLVPGHP
jgi:hypothetical protein